VEILRPGQARRIQLRSYRGILKNAWVCVLYFHSGVRGKRGNRNNVYASIYCPVETVPGDPVRIYCGNLKNMCLCVCACVCVCVCVCVCMYVCMYVYCAVVLVPGGPLRGDVPYRLVAVRGTPKREYVRTNFFL